MTGRIGSYLERRRLRKVLARWADLADAAAVMDRVALKAWQGRAQTMRREIDRLIRAADGRLSQPVSASDLPATPLGTEWAWRPDLWRGPVPGLRGAVHERRTAISDDVTVYHDCTQPEVILRQTRGRGAGQAPFGLALDAYGFDGTFLSLAMQLPSAALEGLKPRHLLRVAVTLDYERPVTAFARLNIKHGPNTEQLVRELAKGAGLQMVEFDLAYAKFDDTRIERIWLDLIFDRPAMNAIILRDVTVSRRPRAEL